MLILLQAPILGNSPRRTLPNGHWESAFLSASTSYIESRNKFHPDLKNSAFRPRVTSQMHRQLSSSSLTRGKMNIIVGSKFTATKCPHKMSDWMHISQGRERLVSIINPEFAICTCLCYSIQQGARTWWWRRSILLGSYACSFICADKISNVMTSKDGQHMGQRPGPHWTIPPFDWWRWVQTPEIAIIIEAALLWVSVI